MENTEATRLLPGKSGHRYSFQSSIIQQRNRRIRQFQCCICAIFLALIAIVLVASFSYDLNDQRPESTNVTQVLLSLQWPIPDKNGTEIIFSDDIKWNEALLAGKNALDERKEIEKHTPELNLDSPSYRHQKSIAGSDKTDLLADVGFAEERAAKYFQKNTGGPIIICQKNSTCGRNFSCNPFQKFRTYDGQCNNLKTNLGTAFSPFRRALPPDYADGISEPRNFARAPSARTVSNAVHRPFYRVDEKFTVMLAVWGQFIDHDITATALSRGQNGSSISCCGPSPRHPECFPVELDRQDPFYKFHNVTCMEFVRSAPAPGCCLGPREQLNQVSAFLDGSVVYGSDDGKVKELRTFEKGLLNMYLTEDNRTLLPVSKDLKDGCNRIEEEKRGRYCFMSGDSRANENLHLTSMHLIWARQHNLLATKLVKINPHWDDERVFQEARRILGAQLQHITYNELLPLIFGQDLMEHFELYPTKFGYFNGYNETIDPSIANNFATATFRFAHTLIPGLIKFISRHEDVQLREMLFDPFKLYQKGELDRALKSAMDTHTEASDPYFSAELKEHLFERGKKHCGLDLVSLNIQRGRDHGLPGYVSWREHCGAERPRNFQQLEEDIDREALKNIRDIYRLVDDIDLYTGTLSERPLKGALLGPTGVCLLLDQFIRLKRGDRFWYENPHVFTKIQLEELHRTSLANIICDNSDDVIYVRQYVMQQVGDSNRNSPCTNVPRPDLNPWKDADLRHIPIPIQTVSVKSAFD